MKKRKNTRKPGMGNSAYIQATLELRRSSASSRHTPKTRKGTRRARATAAIREQS